MWDKETKKALAHQWKMHHMSKINELKQTTEEDREFANSLSSVETLPYTQHQSQYLKNIKRSIERQEKLFQHANAMPVKNPDLLTHSLAVKHNEGIQNTRLEANAKKF